MSVAKRLPAFRRSVVPLMIASAVAAAWSLPAQASSHREAPFITSMPKVDGTDFYMFRSYEPGRAGFVVLVADYYPLQDPFAGPNYFMLDPNAIYEIHVTNDGGAKENITFQFKAQITNDDNKLNVGGKQVSIPIIQNGSKPVDRPNDPGLNVHERFTLDIIRGGRRTGTKQAVMNWNTGGTTFDKPVDNIGNKTIPAYIAYGNKHVWDVSIPGCAGSGRVFLGQRKDPFVVNVGEIFDLVNIKFPAVELNPAAEFAAADNLARKNITSIIMEVPTACLTEGKGDIIGGWTTASMPANRVLQGTTGASTTNSSGEFVQVSRLGMPLVNEVVIGLKDKDKFNASEPKDDAQFLDYVTNPTLPALLEILFGSAGVKAPTNFPRTDLIATFLTGIQGLNQPANVTPSEMLRLNTAIAPTPKGSQSRLGVLGGDNAGFPNGRRPGDDVVDIELRVAMGVLCTLNMGGCKPADAPAGSLKYTDGAYTFDGFFSNDFPFLRAPLPGSPNPDDALKAKVQ